jgi:hypothetical protein
MISHLSIDQQWTALNPSWGNGHMKGEHRMLYNLIEEGETLENIIGGTFGPDLGQVQSSVRQYTRVLRWLPASEYL